MAIPEKYRRIHTICKATLGTIGGRECDVVDARDLYAGLEVTGTEFRHWLKRRILDNPEFTEGVDYETYNGLTRADLTGSKKARDQETKEARLTLETSGRSPWPSGAAAACWALGQHAVLLHPARASKGVVHDGPPTMRCERLDVVFMSQPVAHVLAAPAHPEEGRSPHGDEKRRPYNPEAGTGDGS